MNTVVWLTESFVFCTKNKEREIWIPDLWTRSVAPICLCYTVIPSVYHSRRRVPGSFPTSGYTVYNYALQDDCVCPKLVYYYSKTKDVSRFKFIVVFEKSISNSRPQTCSSAKWNRCDLIKILIINHLNLALVSSCVLFPFLLLNWTVGRLDASLLDHYDRFWIGFLPLNFIANLSVNIQNEISSINIIQDTTKWKKTDISKCSQCMREVKLLTNKCALKYLNAWNSSMDKNIRKFH